MNKLPKNIVERIVSMVDGADDYIDKVVALQDLTGHNLEEAMLKYEPFNYMTFFAVKNNNLEKTKKAIASNPERCRVSGCYHAAIMFDSLEIYKYITSKHPDLKGYPATWFHSVPTFEVIKYVYETEQLDIGHDNIFISCLVNDYHEKLEYILSLYPRSKIEKGYINMITRYESWNCMKVLMKHLCDVDGEIVN